LELAQGLSPTPKNINRVANEVGAENARWAFTQWRLRAKAVGKLPEPEKWFLDEDGLQMASHQALADYHARLFRPGLRVADLTTGIGSDLFALARFHRPPVYGFEIDPARFELVTATMEAFNLKVELSPDPCLSVGWEFDAAFVDPARRTAGRRTLNIEDFQPNPNRLVERLNRLAVGVMKLSPMLSDYDLERLGRMVEFVSYGWECREALVLSGTEVPTGRWAVRAEDGTRLEAKPLHQMVNEVGPSLYEPDPAAIRAHALGTLAERHSLAGWGEPAGYLTGESGIETPWLREFKVLAVEKFDRKALMAQLRRLGRRLVSVKTRGVDADPIEVLKRMKLEQGIPAELIVVRQGARSTSAIVERVPPTQA